MSAAIETTELVKRFPVRKKGNGGQSLWSRFRPGQPKEWLTAVDGVSFQIEEREIFGLLGPNGAGKTTTIRMLCTLLEPTSGTALVNGYDVVEEPDKVRQSLGAVMTGERSIYWKLTGRENLEYFAALYHLPRTYARERVASLLEQFQLAERADELVETYSSGMRHRVILAKALLADQPILLLDEPSLGLDPQAARNMRETIREIKEEGCTILLTTHYMEEADQLCDRVAIIDHGQVIALDAPTELKRSIQEVEILQLEVEGGNSRLVQALGQLPMVQNATGRHLGTDQAWSVTVHAPDSRAALPVVIEAMGQAQARIRSLEVITPTLEDVFISLTGKQLRD